MNKPLSTQLLNMVFPGTRWVAFSWLLTLKYQNLRRGRFKVGFGYINTGEESLGNRKWHIDPIVKHINRYSSKYVCDLFFPKEDLSKFDIVVIVKRFGYINEEEICKVKQGNTKLIYNISDNPAGCSQGYEESHWFLDAVDRILILNPRQTDNIPQYSHKFRNITSPLFETRYKTDYSSKNKVRIFWDGYLNNFYTMERLNEILLKLNEELPQKFEMIYNSNLEERDDGIIKYRRWTMSNWKEMILSADIGVIIKPLDDARQQKKPPTKVISYMGAGLPVVCTPSGADEAIIEHGHNGFFAYSADDWHSLLRRLILDEKLREKVGTAARIHAHEHFSVAKVAKMYTDIFDKLC